MAARAISRSRLLKVNPPTRQTRRAFTGGWAVWVMLRPKHTFATAQVSAPANAQYCGHLRAFASPNVRSGDRRGPGDAYCGSTLQPLGRLRVVRGQVDRGPVPDEFEDLTERPAGDPRLGLSPSIVRPTRARSQ